MSEQTRAVAKTGSKAAVNTSSQESVLQRAAAKDNQSFHPEINPYTEGHFEHDFSRVQVHHHAPTTLQTKLTIGQPGDQYEREADNVANIVMRMPDPGMSETQSIGSAPVNELRREPDDEEEKRKNGVISSHDSSKILSDEMQKKDDDEMMQRKESGAAPSVVHRQSAPPIVHDVLHSSGQPLDPSTLGFMESRFGHDFSGVRVHSDERAADSARAVNALAYTVGRDVVFGAGQYAPGSMAGKRLLAHELTHVVQNNISKIARQTPASDASVPTNEVKPKYSLDYVQEIIDATNRVIPDAAGGVGDFPAVFRILSGLSPSDLQQTLIELDKQGYLDLILSHIGAADIDKDRLNAALTAVKNARSKPAPVSPVSLEKQKADAHQAVDNFRKSAGKQAWPNLDRSTIADGLDQRIDSPSIINQSVLNACGPAAIVYMLASNNPIRFVEIVQALFETGSASLGGEILSSGSDLRKNTSPAKMAQVDWMLMSSMRDSENAIFDFEGDTNEDFSAITTPGDLTHWMKSILKCQNVSWQSAYTFSELDVIRKAGVAASTGKNVALLIDAAMLNNQPKEGKIGYPDHWVVLKSPVVEIPGGKQGDKIQFSVWTWGEKNPRNLNLDKNVFLKTFYGAAICTP